MRHEHDEIWENKVHLIRKKRGNGVSTEVNSISTLYPTTELQNSFWIHEGSNPNQDWKSLEKCSLIWCYNAPGGVFYFYINIIPDASSIVRKMADAQNIEMRSLTTDHHISLCQCSVKIFQVDSCPHVEVKGVSVMITNFLPLAFTKFFHTL